MPRGEPLKAPFRGAESVVVGETREGEILTRFKTAKGKSVSVLDRRVYRQAAALAGKTLRAGDKKKLK